MFNRASRSISSLAALGCIVLSASAQPSQNYTKGTYQIAGGSGLFGQTYTLVSTDGFGPINFTLLSASYAVGRVCMRPGDETVTKQDEKLLVIHYRVKNPNPSDFYFSCRHLFQAVDAGNHTIDDIGESREVSNLKDTIGVMLKPGQGIDDLVTGILVPANQPIPKLILNLGRAGSKELVMRYNLQTKPNLIQPLAAPYADQADKSGSTALASIPAKVGTNYVAGQFDFSVDSITITSGPLGALAPDDGKQFLVVSISATNKILGQFYYNQAFNLDVKTDDGKISDAHLLKAKSDSDFEGQQVDPGDTITARYVIQVPKDAKLSTLSVSQILNNMNDQSRSFVFDLSNLK